MKRLFPSGGAASSFAQISFLLFQILPNLRHHRLCPLPPLFIGAVHARHIVFRPHFFDGLDWAEAEYRSVSGPIRSRWERKGDRVVLTVTVPVNSTATVEAGGKTVEVGAGTHDFKF